MSLGYADRLKNKRNLGGQLGAKEYHQSFDEIKEGVTTLARWVADAKRVFVFTGAGISTACGIPDFRGPNGIWTLRKKKMPIPENLTPFEYARPSFTHMAIAALVAAGKVPYVCSQNVDSLHLWSGVPRRQLAELHGNCFAERCTQCRTEYARDFQMETVDFKPSGRWCTKPGCQGALVDNILDWDTALPEDELDEAMQHAEEADVALVLGTSLQIQPANEIPTFTGDAGGKMVIVNLQKTPKDRRADLIIRGRVDLVMALLMQELGMQVPPYIRTERLVVEHRVTEVSGELAKATRNESEAKATTTSNTDTTTTTTAAAAAATAITATATGSQRVLTINVHSHHGRDCPLPMVESVQISISTTAADRNCNTASSCDAGDDAMQDSSSDVVVVGSGGCSNSSCIAAVAWNPTSSGPLTSPPPTGCSSSSGSGGSSGGFSYTFTGVPLGLRRVWCTLRVRLVKYADEEKRDITLQHPIDLEPGGLSQASQLRPAPPGRGDDAATAMLLNRDRPDVPVRCDRFTNETGCADDDTAVVVRPSAQVHMHTFISQEVRYDPADVVAAFSGNPPTVVPPEPPKKRRQKDAGRTPDEAPPATVPTRASLRLASVMRKRQQPANETPSSSTALMDSMDSDNES